MKLVVIFGPPAVGKTTVGQSLARLTGFKLFHNHHTIDVVTEYFAWGTPPFKRLVGSFRRQIVTEAAASEMPGLIFTYVWAIDEASDRELIASLTDVVAKHGGESYYLELAAGLDERLRRNRSEHRIASKPRSKSNVAETERQLREAEATYRMQTDGDFFYPERHLKIDNTALEPDDVAQRAKQFFGF